MVTPEALALGGHPEGFAATLRTDRWWVAPAATAATLVAFVVYTTWAAMHLHRDALYGALVFLPILFADAAQAFVRDGRFGVGVASLALLANAMLLAGYTFGCHSLRHLVGGRDDCMSCGRVTPALRAWRASSWFNARHMAFAWVSLVWVALSDVYVRLVSMGLVRDLNTWE